MKEVNEFVFDDAAIVACLLRQWNVSSAMIGTAGMASAYLIATGSTGAAAASTGVWTAQPAPPTFYVPLAQLNEEGWGSSRSIFLIARTEGDPAAHWSAIVMQQPAGRYAVGIAGLCVAGYGIAQIVRALRRKVDDLLRSMKLRSDTKRWVILACKFGIAARGVGPRWACDAGSSPSPE